jgi:hypothetical protein
LAAGLLTNSLKAGSFQVMPESFIPWLYVPFPPCGHQAH